MAAVIRLKRYLDDEPLSALILKRRKLNEDNSNDEISTVLTFAGTINNQDDDISPHISQITKENLEKSYKKHVPNLTSKLRQEVKENSDESRFRIVNFFRSIDKVEPKASEAEEKVALTVLDVEPGGLDPPGDGQDQSDYVYDLYYTNSEGIDDSDLNGDFTVCPANEIVFDDGLAADSDHDTDDSNDENNWRNDYPDEEDDEEEIDEENIREAMNGVNLDGNDLSSDDEDLDRFLYSNDCEGVTVDDDLNHIDCRRYGEMYARFKIRQKCEEEMYNKDLYHDELDDTDDDFLD